MMSVTTYSDYRPWLVDLLEQRRRRNPSYSQRAFARDLGLPVPQLSEVLSFRKGLSPLSATRVAKALGLAPHEASHLCVLVEAQHARSKSARIRALERVRSTMGAGSSFSTIDDSLFARISGWEHYAILELCCVNDFVLTVNAAADALSLSPARVEAAIKRLTEAGLLAPTEADGVPSWQRGKGPITTSHNIPSEAIREHHRQMVEKAHASIDNTPVNQRDLSAITMAISVEKFPAAQERIRNFRRELCSFLEDGPQSEVYCLAVQLFPLSRLRRNR